MADEGDSKYVLVICKKCSARMHPAITDAGKRITCPDCGTGLVVPALKAQPKRSPKKESESNTYRVAGLESSGTKPRPPAAAPRYMLVLCPVCSARLHPRIEHAGKRARCPDCDTRFVIPAWKPSVEREPEPVAVEEYNVGASVERRVVERHFVQEISSAVPVPPADPPKWTFFSRVFTFPWRGLVVRSWLVLSVAFFLIELMLMIILPSIGVIGGAPPSMQVIMAGFIMLGFVWLAAMTLFFMSATMMAIIEETASGADEMQELPTVDWREWLFPGLAFGFVLVTALAAGSGIRYLLVDVIGLTYGGMDIAVFILFPILLLSALESGSIAPISLPVWQSVLRYWWVWGLFYLLSAAVVIAVTVAAILLAQFGVMPGAIFLAPAAAATVIIYARLMGRLAWRITLIDGDRHGDDEIEADEEPRATQVVS